MHISPKKFWIVFVLFLLMPFSIHWKLIAFGKKTTGVAVLQVTEDTPLVENIFSGSTFTLVEFNVGDSSYSFHTPEDVKYEPGEKIPILYNTHNPEQYIMFNFAGLVLSPKMYLPAILLLIWIAFYRTVKDMEGKKKLNIMKKKNYLSNR